MVWVDQDKGLQFLANIHDWLFQSWIFNELDPDYRVALASILHAVWPGTDTEKKYSYIPLPSLCGHALGKVSPSTTAVNAAWVLLFVASYILDKLEDEEVQHPIFSKYSPGVVMNLTTGLILHSGRILAELGPLDVSDKLLLEIRREFHQQALSVCAGQHHDLTIKEPDFEQVWKIVDAKSGKFFALGAYLGARLATNDHEKVALFSEIGRRLGIINQINNDLGGLGSREETGSDLAFGRRTLPVQYALMVLPPEKYAMLVEYLHNAVQDPSAELKARQMILSAGAVIYLSLEAAKHRQQASTMLESLHLPSDQSLPLHNLLKHSIRL